MIEEPACGISHIASRIKQILHLGLIDEKGVVKSIDVDFEEGVSIGTTGAGAGAEGAVVRK